MKTHSIPLKVRSAKSDYACPDGEIAGAANLRFINGALIPDNGSNISRLPEMPDSPFIDGVLQRPPLPEVEFSLMKSIVDGWHIHSDMLPSKIVDAPSVGKDTTPGESDWGGRAMEVIADFEEDSRRQNLFTQPFFVLTAYRLKDGFHICPSPPVLMIPNSGPLMVEGSSDFSVPTMKMNVLAVACRLRWRVKMPELTEKWRKLITHLDVFVSLPIPLYNPKGTAKGCHRVECGNFSHSTDSSGTSGEHIIISSIITQGWKSEDVDEATVAQNITATDSYKLISEMPITDVKTSESFDDVAFHRGGLPILSSLETYTPDFAHLSEVTAEGYSFFSGRVTAWNLSVMPPAPLPLALSTPHSTEPSPTPRWIFHPSPNVSQYFFTSESKTYALPLRNHPTMHGSFYWAGFGKSASYNLQEVGMQDNQPDRKCMNLPGGIWRSEKGTTHLFPDILLQEMHVGEVIAVCRAFRASGLVATTAPTAYAFTTEGVFLLKEMDNGTFRDAGLICGYRLRDKASLKLLPKGVRFVTADGEVIAIEGTKVSVSEEVEAVSDEDDSWKDFIPVEWNIDGPDFTQPGGWCAFVTRPIKLSDAEGWKQLRRIALRGVFDPEAVSMAVYCSPDLRSWQKIVVADRSRIDGLWSPRTRFFRIAVKAILLKGHSLQALSVIIKEQ